MAKLVKIKLETKKFVNEGNNGKILVFGLLLCVVLMGLHMFSQANNRDKFIINSSGDLTRIVREDVSQPGTYYLRLKAKNKNETITKNIKITISGISEVNTTENIGNSDTKSGISTREIANVIQKVENANSSSVEFPSVTENGTKLNWTLEKNKNIWILLLIMPLVVAFIFKNSKAKIVKDKKYKIDDIKRSLPEFTDQLLLLLNSGLIFNDSLEKIVNGYLKKDVTKRNYFKNEIIYMYQSSIKKNQNLIGALVELSHASGVKEFTRIVNIILDNQYKGTNLTGKLELEGELLWKERKNLAEEKGKLAETKLTFPLAMLLMVLIIITAAPAILQI